MDRAIGKTTRLENGGESSITTFLCLSSSNRAIQNDSNQDGFPPGKTPKSLQFRSNLLLSSLSPVNGQSTNRRLPVNSRLGSVDILVNIGERQKVARLPRHLLATLTHGAVSPAMVAPSAQHLLTAVGGAGATCS